MRLIEVLSDTEAQWVNKAKITQVAEIVDVQKRNLYLVAFIDHWYRLWQRAGSDERERLLEHITNASILTWQHVNLHGTYDFSNLLSSNDSEYTLDEVLNFKAA